MPLAKRILWGDGMFLRPQHFQQQALRNEQDLAATLQSRHRHHWGLRDIAINETSLAAGQVHLAQLSLLFRDGTLYQAPQRDPLPLSRDLGELACSSTIVHACLAQLQAHGQNMCDDGQAVRPTRFRSQHQESCDLYTAALESDIGTLELDVRLLLEEENRDGYDSIPVARIMRDATGHWTQDASYIPPLLSTEGSAEVQRMLRRLLDILLVKNRILAAAHRERSRNVMEFSSADIGTFWLLHTVNRNFARLSHLSRCQPLAPEQLYMALAEFAAELQTFSSSYGLADIPAYQHEALGTVLPVLDKQIRELLDTVISSRYAIIPLQTNKPSFHIGHLESDRLLENVDYYLSVQSEMPAAQLIETIPVKTKIGAPDDVDKILNSAMRGVALSHTTQTPPAIPVRVGNHYFALQPHGELYQRMLQSRSICIYMPQTLSNLSLELIAVFR